MRTGQIFAIVGAILVYVGLGLFNPLFRAAFDGKVVPMFELEVAEKFVYGVRFPGGDKTAEADEAAAAAAEEEGVSVDIPILGPLFVFAGLALLVSIVAFFVRSKKQLALTNLLFGVAIIGVMAYVHLNALAILVQAHADAIVKGEMLVTLEGPYFCYLGGFMILLGALIVFASRPVWRASDRFLRVAMLWNGSVIREEVFFEPRNITVGEDVGSTFILPTATVGHLPKRFVLFRKDRKGRYDVALLPQMHGKLKIQHDTMPISQYLANQGASAGGDFHYVPIQSGDWGIMNVGELSLYFQFVRPEAPIRHKSLAAMPWDLAASTTLSAVVQIAFILATVFLWKEEAVRVKRKDVRKLLQATVQTKLEEPEEELLDTGEEEDTTAKAAEGEEGKFGDPDIDPEIESKVPKRDGKMVNKIDPKKVGLNDLLSTSRLGGKGAISNILSANTSGFSNKLAVAMSGTGSEFVMGHGAGGLGFQGTGTGGGGTGGYGRIHGLGKIDTGGGVGARARMGRKKKRRVGKLRLSGGSSQGFCSRGDIAKNVRLRAGAIRACYERQLQIKPSLAGKVTIRWTIHLDGHVRSAGIASSSIHNKAVENCILRAIRRIRFKKPEGGICIVKWPFVFNPG